MKGTGEEGTLSGRMAYLLKQKGLTQKELANRAGVTEAAMSHYLKGDRHPRISVLARIADALGTTTDYLISGEDNGKVDEVSFATRLIARNRNTMTKEQKMEIIKILISED